LQLIDEDEPQATAVETTPLRCLGITHTFLMIVAAVPDSSTIDRIGPDGALDGATAHFAQANRLCRCQTFLCGAFLVLVEASARPVEFTTLTPGIPTKVSGAPVIRLLSSGRWILFSRVAPPERFFFQWLMGWTPQPRG
jgi:hypothetical protein